MDIFKFMMELYIWYYLGYNEIYDWIKYIISEKSGIAYIIIHNFAKIKVDSYDSLPLEKTMTFHNVIILTKSLSIRIKLTATIIYS